MTDSTTRVGNMDLVALRWQGKYYTMAMLLINTITRKHSLCRLAGKSHVHAADQNRRIAERNQSAVQTGLVSAAACLVRPHEWGATGN